jgi:hypothetical protein
MIEEINPNELTRVLKMVGKGASVYGYVGFLFSCCIEA